MNFDEDSILIPVFGKINRLTRKSGIAEIAASGC